MTEYFHCKNDQKISWRSVCDGDNHCRDGSDEEHCHCQGDVYPCLQGNNVSCRLACATYGRVTCLTYQNRRACEHYIQEFNTVPSNIDQSSILMNDLDALQYSAGLVIGILLFVSILSILICIIGRKPSEFLFSCLDQSNRKSSNRLSSISHPPFSSAISHYTPAPHIHHFPPPFYYCLDENLASINGSYELPPSFASLHRSNSLYYETIRASLTSNSMSLLEPYEIPEM